MRKDRKWKRRAEEPAGRKRQLVLKKRSEVDVLRLEPRTVRLLAKSALLTHLWLRMPSALSRMLVILQRKEPADMKRQLILEKREKWTLWDSNPGPSGYLPNLLTHFWLRMPSALSRMLTILQRKEPVCRKHQLIHEKKKRSGRSGTRTQDRPVMSRML